MPESDGFCWAGIEDTVVGECFDCLWLISQIPKHLTNLHTQTHWKGLLNPQWLQLLYYFKNIYLFFGYQYTPYSCSRLQKSEEGTGPMEGQFQVVVSHCMGAKAKPKSSMWEADTHNFWSIIPAYIYSLWVNVIRQFLLPKVTAWRPGFMASMSVFNQWQRLWQE